MKRALPPAEIERLIAGNAMLSSLAAEWRGKGYEMTACRVWRRRDGGHTLRVVWRSRGAIVSFSFTWQGAMP